MPNENNIQETVQELGNWHSKLINTISLIVIGFGIGWLVGLSVTPVVSIIITSIVSVAVTLMTVISGLKAWTPKSEESETIDRPHNDLNVTPIPIAILIAGILLGSGFGVFARTHNLLGSQLSFEVKKWTDIGLDKKEVAQRLFDSEYPKRTSSSETSSKVPAESSIGSDSSKQSSSKGVLFGVESDECDRLLNYKVDELPIKVKSSSIKEIRQLPNMVQEPENLKQVLEVICKIYIKPR